MSAETLQQILAYLNDALKRSLSERFGVVDRAGPRVLRIRTAVTGVAAEDEGLKPYQYVPIALVATMASRSASGTPQRAFMEGEEEGTDKRHRRVAGAEGAMATGERLSRVGDAKSSFDTLKPVLDEVAAGVFRILRGTSSPSETDRPLIAGGGATAGCRATRSVLVHGRTVGRARTNPLRSLPCCRHPAQRW